MTQVEFSAIEWANRKGKLVIIEAPHACTDPGCGVFRCRHDKRLPLPTSCGRYVGNCFGGSPEGDAHCADCIEQYREKLKRAVLAHVRKAAWRGEVGMCLKFGRDVRHPPTEDALYELVQDGILEWFGENDRPLRYRVARKVMATRERVRRVRPLTAQEITSKLGITRKQKANAKRAVDQVMSRSRKRQRKLVPKIKWEGQRGVLEN